MDLWIWVTKWFILNRYSRLICVVKIVKNIRHWLITIQYKFKLAKEILTPETNKLLGNTGKNINKDKYA